MHTHCGKTKHISWASSSKVFQGYWNWVFWLFPLIKELYSNNNWKNNLHLWQWTLVQSLPLLPLTSFLFSLLIFTGSLSCVESYWLESDWFLCPGLLSIHLQLLFSVSSVFPVCNCGFSTQTNHGDGWGRAGEVPVKSKGKVKGETEQVKQFLSVLTWCWSLPMAF